MALLENLVKGFAGAAGNQNVVSQIEKHQANRKATSDEELHANAQSILNNVSGLQQKRAALDPKSPTYKTDLAANDAALHDARQLFTDLYHPAKNPGALSKLVGHVKAHLSGKQPAQTAGELRKPLAERMSALDASAAAGPERTAKEAADPYTGFSPEDALKARRIKAGLDPKETGETKWKPRGNPYKGADGTFYQTEFDTTGNSRAKPMPEGYTPPTGPAPKIGSFGDFVTQTYGTHPTSAQYTKARSLWTPISETVGVHTVMVPQPDNTIKPVQVEVTSVRGPVGRVGVPRTAGEAKGKVKKPTGGVVSEGEAVGGKATAAQTDADKKYNDSVRIAAIADDALKSPSAAKDKQLALQIIRGAAGRVNMQEIDMMMSRAGLANKLEAWANSATTGQLPTDVRQQLVDVTHTNRDAADKARQASRGGSNVSDDDFLKNF